MKRTARQMSQNQAPVSTQAPYHNARGDSVVKPMAIIMVAQALSKCLLLLREMLVGACFGASALTDAFNVGLYISNYVPTIMRPLVEDTFIPVYVERLAQDRENAQDLLEAVGTLVFLMAVVIALGIYIFAPWLVMFIVPGFSSETLKVTTQIVRVMALFALILTLTNFGMSTLTAHKAFLLVGLAPLSVAMVTIAMVWLLSGTLGIHSLTWGLVVGVAVQLGIFGVGLARRRLLHPRINLHFRKVFDAVGVSTLLMFLVRLIGIGVGWVDRSLSSQLTEGSIAALGFARNIYQLPFQVCVLAVTTVAITQFSWHIAQADLTSLKHDFSLAVRIAAFFLIPTTVALIVLGQPTVRVLYERGAFTAQDTAMTASALLFYALGLVPQSIVFISVRLLLACKETYYILSVTLVSAAVHVLLDWILVGPMKQDGIALATSISVMMMSAMSLWLIRRHFGSLGGCVILISFAKISLAALGMGIVIGLLWLWQPISNPMALLALLVVLGLTTFLSLATALQLTELQLLIAILSKRLRSGLNASRNTGGYKR